MKNIDKIKTMNIEVMAKFLTEDGCERCAYGNSICQSGQCKEGISYWLNMESEFTQNDIVNALEINCSSIFPKCEHNTCWNCKVDYIVKHFNINNGKITKIEK